MSSSVKKPLRELSVTEIFGQSLSLYLVKFFQFLLPFLIVGLVSGAFNVVTDVYFPWPTPPEPEAPPEAFLRWLPDFLSALIVKLGLSGVVTWTVSTIANGVAVKYASDLLERGDASLKEGFSFTVSRLPSLLTAGVITGVLMVLGLICLIVPGVIIAIVFALVVPVIVIERIGALESLGRSRRLVSKRWGKTFGISLLIGIVFLIVGWAVPTTESPLGPASSIITSLITAVVQPVLPIALTFLYYSMIAKEASNSQCS